MKKLPGSITWKHVSSEISAQSAGYPFQGLREWMYGYIYICRPAGPEVGGLDSAWRSSAVSPWEQFVVVAVGVSEAVTE